VNPGVKISSATQPFLNSEAVCKPLTEQLLSLGFKIENSVRNSDFLISLNHNQDLYSEFRRAGGKKERAALIRLEPEAVYPAQHRSRVENLYGVIITPGSLIGDSTPRIPWPYYFNQNPLQPETDTLDLKMVISNALSEGVFDFAKWMERPITLSLIASNKVSSIRENNYKLRRKIAFQIPKGGLSVYGGLWNENFLTKIRHRAGVVKFALNSKLFPNLLEVYGNFFRKYVNSVGSVTDKHEVVKMSKFSLIIENDNNYISEKLIDAFLGGSIPIFFGGDFEKIGIPPKLVFSNFTNARDISNIIAQVSDKDVRAYQEGVVEWLQSDLFLNQWEGDLVFATIADEITKYFRNAVK
jgi:hypothetical protein